MTFSDDFDITIRINESGIHVCREALVRNDFGPDELYDNEPFESILLPSLTKAEREMVFKFRSRYPAQPDSTIDPEVANQ